MKLRIPHCLLLLLIGIFSVGCNFEAPAKNASVASSFTSTDETTTAEDVEIPIEAKLLIKHYDKVIGYKENEIIFSDGSTIIYDDGIKNKTQEQLLNSPDIQDQFFFIYQKGADYTIEKNYDPGRIRNEAFFKKIYGASSQEVRKNLITVNWCPKLVNQKILVTTVNGVADKIKLISEELDKLPQYKKYIQNIGGTFNWRNIKGTNRLSMHSFGMTIDLNTQYSNYWQWDCRCTNENQDLAYKNQIPQEIIAIFEKHGFIWGGKWYHYDTMHFEYRPELLDEKLTNKDL